MSAFVPPAVEDVPTVGELVAAMDRTVAGLTEVKLYLATVLHRFQVAAALGRSWRPPNILVMGPSGGGKTHTLRALLEASCVVYAEANATEYSDVGFHGRNLVSMYAGLVAPKWRGLRGDDDVIRQKDFVPIAEKWGVVLIDEIDKLRHVPGMGEDRQGGKSRALQAELLKLVEGADILVQRSDDDPSGFMFQTHHVLHIGIGAFQGLAEMVARANNMPATQVNVMEKVAITDVVRYGFLEELVGRFSMFAPLPQLTIDAVRRIFVEQVLPRYQAEFRDLGITLEVDEGGVQAIASYCKDTVIGARALQPKLESILWRSYGAAKHGDQLFVGADEVTKGHAQLRSAVAV